MKTYRSILFFMAVLLLAGIAALTAITHSYRGSRTNPLLMNDMIQSVKEHWDDPEALDSLQPDIEFCVFDYNDFLHYASSDAAFAEISSAADALNKGCLCLTVADSSRFLGTIVIPDSDRLLYEASRRKLQAAAAVMVLLFLLAGGIYGIYVHRSIVLPFQRMERFAENVAAGMLDEPLMLDQDNLFGAFTQSFDIMREELRAARHREEALKMKEKELVASLSHDIKTPITGIKLLCELLQVTVKDPYVLKKLAGIDQNAEQINVLVSDLLSAALDDLDEMQIQCQDEPSALIRTLLDEHDTQKLVRVQEIPDCMICVDPVRLSQIFGNLISNSYKYAGTEIQVCCRTQDSFLEVEIADSGMGVPEDEIDLITNKFYRGKTNSAGKDGSGLGLYIARVLIDKMHGELICSNKNGFCVTLLLPLS